MAARRRDVMMLSRPGYGKCRVVDQWNRVIFIERKRNDG